MGTEISYIVEDVLSYADGLTLSTLLLFHRVNFRSRQELVNSITANSNSNCTDALLELLTGSVTVKSAENTDNLHNIDLLNTHA